MANIAFFGLLISSIIVITLAIHRKPFILDKRWVCQVKQTCYDCLSLPHCSWCSSLNKCYSNKIPQFEDFCKNDTIEIEDFGFSFSKNAECSCANGMLERDCHAPNTEGGPECSGRGTCVCGQCVCTANPDPDFPTKMVMGQFCEYDNYSCDGPECNEGPYPLDMDLIREDGEHYYDKYASEAIEP